MFYPSDISYNLVQAENNISYIEFDMSNYPLKPGEELLWGQGLQFGLHHNDWKVWDLENDPSFMIGTTSATFALSDKVAVVGSGSQLLNDWSCYESEGLPIGDIALEVLAKDQNLNDNYSTNPVVVIENTGTLPVDHFEMRYYFTVNEAGAPHLDIWGQPEAQVSLVRYGEREYYVKALYDRSLKPGEQTDWGTGLSFRLFTDWQILWNKADDYSNQGLGLDFSRTQQIVLYDKDGQILWGEEPLGATDEPYFNGDNGSNGNDGNNSSADAVVLGFEDEYSWSSPQQILGYNLQQFTQGEQSLQIKGIGWTSLQSRPFSASGLIIGDQLSIDLWLPANQPNPWWIGELSASLSIPSQNIYSYYLGRTDLNQIQQGRFNTLSYDLPVSVITALNQSPDDVVLHFNLNVQANSGDYLLDNISFDANEPVATP